MFPRGEDKIQIHIFRIKNKGSNQFDLIIEERLDSIVMGKPKNDFQKRVLDDYARCRTVALHKYFPMIKDKDIDILLRDNYLQVEDINRGAK